MKSFTKKIDTISTLFATLPQQQINELVPLIKDAISLPSISLVDLIKQIKDNGMNSIYFPILKNYFNQLFGEYNQTILDDDNHLIIGNGLDLTDYPDAIALFYTINPKVDWKSVLTQPGQPNPPLTPNQLSELLCLSLIAVKNNYGKFPGYLMQLEKCMGNFAQTVYATHQLFGLVSLSALNNGTFPSTFKLALSQYQSTNNDLSLIETIIDYSNVKNDVATQNNLLNIAAMTHGNVTDPQLDVHITYRQTQRLAEHKHNIFNISNGPVKWGAPVGAWQDTFVGLGQSYIFPSLNPNNGTNDSIYLGTPGDDIFNVKAAQSGAAFYSGDGDDVISFTQSSNGLSSSSPNLIYMGGR